MSILRYLCRCCCFPCKICLALFHVVVGCVRLVGNSEKKKMKGQKGRRKIAQPAGSSSRRDDITSKLRCRTSFLARTENLVARSCHPNRQIPYSQGSDVGVWSCRRGLESSHDRISTVVVDHGRRDHWHGIHTSSRIRVESSGVALGVDRCGEPKGKDGSDKLN